MSLGPEPVTDQVRAKERAEVRARKRQTGEPRVTPRKTSKKRKTVSPELEERQKRASARMAELDVPPLLASIRFLV